MTEHHNKPNIEPDILRGPVREFVDGTEPIHSNLKEIREAIDKIDSELVNLLSERMKLVVDATRFKRDTNEVIAPERQQQVIDSARENALIDSALPDGFPSLVTRIYGVMTSGYIALQLKAFKKTKPVEDISE